uniref:Uncharacterized protein n=1 Tax=Anguilla anguilla TaxID=7936 RepID=A0A0E9PLA5_ANGAN
MQFVNFLAYVAIIFGTVRIAKVIILQLMHRQFWNYLDLMLH